MARPKLFALLVGVAKYDLFPTLNDLNGCENDVNNVEHFLREKYAHYDLQIEQLVDGKATRANIIEGFKRHLGNAQEGDFVLFYYSGHGSREESPKAFAPFDPAGKSETLVCYDSRRPRGWDLADKELAYLLSQIDQSNPQITVILDCCHSGSGTRLIDEYGAAGIRKTRERPEIRPLSQYYGYDPEQTVTGIPRASHILLSACRNVETATEVWFPDGYHGIFTHFMLEVLKEKSQISYAELFLKVREVIKRNKHNQTPQFQTFGYFNPHHLFLTSTESQVTYFPVTHYNGHWTLDAGLLTGLKYDIRDPEPVRMAIYDSAGKNTEEQKPLCLAQSKQIGLTETFLDPEKSCHLDEDNTYYARILSMPTLPWGVQLSGDNNELKKAIRLHPRVKALNIVFEEKHIQSEYEIRVTKDILYLHYTPTGLCLQAVRGPSGKIANHIFRILKRIQNWHWLSLLQNPKHRDSGGWSLGIFKNKKGFDPDNVDFQLEIDGEVQSATESGIQLLYDDQDLYPVINVKNNTDEDLYAVTYHLSSHYGIEALPVGAEGKLNPGAEAIIFGDLEGDALYLEEGVNDEITLLKLVASTAPIQEFAPTQEDIDIDSTVKTLTGPEVIDRDLFDFFKKKLPDWFSKTMTIQLKRILGKITAEKDIDIPGRNILIKKHPDFRGSVMLRTARSHLERTDATAEAARLVSSPDMELINFSPVEGQDESILEISQVKNESTLIAVPLEIRLSFGLTAGERLIPVAFDGDDAHLAGKVKMLEDGTATVLIDRIPSRKKDQENRLDLFFFEGELRYRSQGTGLAEG